MFNIRAKLTVAVEEAIDVSVATAVQTLTQLMNRRFKTRDEEDAEREYGMNQKFNLLVKETNERIQTLATVANKNIETTQANFIQCVNRMSRLEAIAREQDAALRMVYLKMQEADLAVARETKLEIATSDMMLCELIEALADALKLELAENQTGEAPAMFVPLGTALEESANDQLADAHQMISDAEGTLKVVKELRGETKKLVVAPAKKGGKK